MKGALRPKVAILTTPNVEFNVVWGMTPKELRRWDLHLHRLVLSSSPMHTLTPTLNRHWDHRFEWSRQEFREWAADAATTYGYKVNAYFSQLP